MNPPLSIMSATRLAVLTQVAAGKRTGEIAAQLSVTVPAITRHLRICRDLGLIGGPHTGVWEMTGLGVSLLEALAKLTARSAGFAASPEISVLEAHALLLLISGA